MLIFRLSQRLNTKIKAGPLTPLSLQENPYADWSARVFSADRTQYILLSHTVSLYSVVFYGRGIISDGFFIKRALDTLREFMAEDGLGPIYTKCVAPTSDSVRFCRPLNRSVTGSMNELELTARTFLESGEWSPFDVGFRLNGMSLSAIDDKQGGIYAMPRRAFTALQT